MGALRAVEEVGRLVAGRDVGRRVRVRVLDAGCVSVAAREEEAVPGCEEGRCRGGEDHVAVQGKEGGWLTSAVGGIWGGGRDRGGRGVVGDLPVFVGDGECEWHGDWWIGVEGVGMVLFGLFSMLCWSRVQVRCGRKKE